MGNTRQKSNSRQNNGTQIRLRLKINDWEKRINNIEKWFKNNKLNKLEYFHKFGISFSIIN
jgi:hypothetical protein